MHNANVALRSVAPTSSSLPYTHILSNSQLYSITLSYDSISLLNLFVPIAVRVCYAQRQLVRNVIRCHARLHEALRRGVRAVRNAARHSWLINVVRWAICDRSMIWETRWNEAERNEDDRLTERVDKAVNFTHLVNLFFFSSLLLFFKNALMIFQQNAKLRRAFVTLFVLWHVRVHIEHVTTPNCKLLWLNVMKLRYTHKYMYVKIRF